MVAPRQRSMSRPSSPSPFWPSSPLFATAAASGLGADTSTEGNVAPDFEKHHEEPVIVEDLGASQTGAESEVVIVSAEYEQVSEQQQVPPPKPQAPRPIVTP